MAATTARPHDEQADPLGTLPDGTAHYAPVGEMQVLDDHALCHLCGRWFRSVGTHLRVHGWDRARYRQAFGLERRQPLEGDGTRSRRSGALLRRRASDPTVRAGCEVGRHWVDSGELARAAARSARGRRQPEQRRRKTVRTLSQVSVQARSEATTRASVARLTAIADRAARTAGYPMIGDLVRDRVAAGTSLAALSREAGLHKDWLSRHLSTVDPQAARAIAGRLRGAAAPRHDAAIRPRVAALGYPDVGAFLRRRHLDERLSVRAIAGEIGVSRPSVEAAMVRHGIPRIPHATSRHRAARRADAVAVAFGFDGLDDYLADRRGAGMSWRRIADECGQPATWLRRRAGLTA